MFADSESDLRRTINDLVARLPPNVVRGLLGEIETMGQPPADRLRLVRQSVIDHLNRQRTNRARRLFTTLFEPFLVDDDVLLHAEGPVAGAIQRVDVGCLWETLSRDAFPALAVEAQQALDEAASTDLIDRALQSPRAVRLRERMRAAAVAHIDAAGANRKTLTALLEGLSANRARRARMAAAFVERPAPFTARTLRTMRTVLAGMADRGPIADVADRLAAVPAASAVSRERERAAAMLEDAAAALEARHPDDTDAVDLLALSTLHVRRNWAAVALLVRHSRDDDPRAAALVAGLDAHYFGTLKALTAGLAGVLKLTGRAPGATIRPSPKDRARLEALVQRLVQLREALDLAGLTEDRRTAPAYRLAWEAAARVMATAVAGVALERASALASSRRHAVGDHAEIVWLVRFVWGWCTTANAHDLEAFDLHTWRQVLLDEMRANLDRALKVAPEESLDERMAHLLRIDAVCGAFGERISAWIPPSSHNMTQIVTHRLSGDASAGPEERALIDDVVAAARAEVGRNRYWKSGALMDLIELAERTRR